MILQSIDYQDYKENDCLSSYKVLIHTAWGYQEVTGIRSFSDGDWIVCGKENVDLELVIVFAIPLLFIL